VRAGRPVREVARARVHRVDARTAPEWRLIELADADKRTGEVTAERIVAASELPKGKVGLRGRDVLVSKLRPELGNVAIAPEGSVPMAGSAEWVPLETPRPHYLFHALRAPAWRGHLPVTGGQTRPRTTVDAVLDSRVRWPGDALADRIDATSAALFEARARVHAQLVALQSAVDRHAAGEIDDARLAAELSELDEV